MLAASAGSAQDAKAPAIDPAIVERAADLLYTRELDRARTKRTLDAKHEQFLLARRTSTLLMTYASTLPAAAGWSWAIHVDARDDPIAYCLPGGRIMLSSGLFERTKLTGPELAAVLAHVIAHAVAGDDVALAAQRFAALPESPDPNRQALQLADILGKIVLTEPHDKAAERETDAMALELMARAGVDPEPTVEAWRKIARAGGATAPAFLALHPTSPGRIDEIEAQIPSILPLYEQARAEQAARPRMPPVRTRPGLN